LLNPIEVGSLNNYKRIKRKNKKISEKEDPVVVIDSKPVFEKEKMIFENLWEQPNRR